MRAKAIESCAWVDTPASAAAQSRASAKEGGTYGARRLELARIHSSLQSNTREKRLQ